MAKIRKSEAMEISIDLPVFDLALGVIEVMRKNDQPDINIDFHDMPDCEGYRVRLVIERIDE